MRHRLSALFGFLGTFVALLVLHYPFLRLPYFWDEAGYYIPAALDFYQRGHLIPENTLATGHTPLVMVYLGSAWHIFGFSLLVTHAAMLLVAAATVAALHALGRRVVQEEAGKPQREISVWSAVLLALSPLFFAQSSLAHLDLAAALFTTLAVFALVCGRLPMFTVASSLAIMSKETAIVLLPVAWTFAWRRLRARQLASPRVWIALTLPVLPLLVWTIYYHHATGYWTGNREYLEYNLYATLNPMRILLSLLRRFQELFIAGFNFLLVAGAIAGVWLGRNSVVQDRSFWSETQREDRKARIEAADTRPLKAEGSEPEGVVAGTHISAAHGSDAANLNRPGLCRERRSQQADLCGDFLFLAVGLCAAYILMLSVVGGAILPRYLLPVFPLFYLVGVTLIWRMPTTLARGICLVVVACLISSWFVNPPYPFPFEDNLAYADFVRLHQQAAHFLENRPGRPRILTAWPASDELRSLFLGYVTKPLNVTSVRGFSAADFSATPVESFDLLYLYSRSWEPASNWVTRFGPLLKLQERYFGYAPQIQEETLTAHYNLRLLQDFERRGQWVRIYSKQ